LSIEKALFFLACDEGSKVKRDQFVSAGPEKEPGGETPRPLLISGKENRP
jgi:hypothetical protein